MRASRLTEVLLARGRLLARSEAERLALAGHGAGLAPPLRLVDRALDAGRFLRAHPAVVVVAGAVIALLRGRTLLSLGVRGYGLWRLLQRARIMLRRAGY
jgi:hypothetical protein